MQHTPKFYVKQNDTHPFLPFRDYLDLARPMTLLPLFIMGFVGGIMVHLAFAYALLFGILLVMMQAGGQSLNQSNLQEIEIDKINGKIYRPTVSGKISLINAKIMAYSLLAIGFAISILLGVWIYGLFMVMLAVSYTERPFYLKRLFPINLLLQATARGFLPIYTLGIISHVNTLPLAIFALIWTCALQPTKDFNDVAGDREFGVQTLPVLMSKANVQKFMFILSIADYVFAVYVGLWFLVFLFPLDIVSILYADRKMKIAENSLGWVSFYMSLGLSTVFGLGGLAGTI
jgi:geranylgeranylglycerol-phosphate geranylgeranyltransferase